MLLAGHHGPVADKLTVQVREDDDLVWTNEVVFVLNGVPLRELVRARTGDDWVGPPAEVVAQPDHLFGGPDRWEDARTPWYDDPALLSCTCGQPGCRAVVAHIDVDDAQVRWSNFRTASGEEVISLDLGPYVFDRDEYEALFRGEPPDIAAIEATE